MLHLHWKRIWLAYLVLACGLAMSLGSFLYVRQSLEAQNAQGFDAAVRVLQDTASREMDRYIDALLAARGFYYAARDGGREDWRTYVESLRLPEQYPGVQAIGFVKRVPADERQAHENAVRNEGFPGYRVHPVEPPREFYYPIVLIEPFDQRNQRAFGYDMFSEPVRRAAMVRAADTGAPAASGKVTLIQEDGVDVQPGFLVYVPVYRPRAPLGTPAQRRAVLEGYIYSPYRIRNLMHAILGSRPETEQIQLRLYASTAPEPGALLFDSADGANPSQHGGLSQTHTLAVAGQPWTFEFFSSPSFAPASTHYLPWLVLASGALVAWLLFGVTWLQIRGRAISEEAAVALRKSQQALQASETRYRLKIEQSPMAIQIFDHDGRTRYVNPSWRQLWSFTGTGVPVYNILEDQELVAHGVMDQVRRAFHGESVVIGPIRYDAAPVAGAVARPRWVRTVMYPIKLDGDQVQEVVAMHEDFTARKSTEEELRRTTAEAEAARLQAETARQQAEAANQAKDHFLAVLSHELRNPLSPVLAMVNTIQSHTLGHDELAEALDVIQRNVELEARLIDDLLDMTRISRGKLHLDLQPTEAHTVLRHALEICQADLVNKHQTVVLHPEAAASRLMADPARLQQVFWNLIKNAIKFTPVDGTITIRTRNQATGDRGQGLADGVGSPLTPDPSGLAPSLVIEVADSGIGIEPPALARIFEAFEQADRSITQKFGGLGLGLAISKALVEAHHGTLTAASAGKNRGATFTVTLPALAPGERIDGASRRLSEASTGGAPATEAIRILLVEDQIDARRGMRLLLEKSGYCVAVAGTVAEALRIAEHFPFDVLLSDLGLPDATGLDLIRTLRARRNGFRAIALTGLGMDDDVQKALDAGFDLHLTKPVHFARLQAAIRELALEPKALSD